MVNRTVWKNGDLLQISQYWDWDWLKDLYKFKNLFCRITIIRQNETNVSQISIISKKKFQSQMNLGRILVTK